MDTQVAYDFRRSVAADPSLGAGNYFYRFADRCSAPDTAILECDQNLVVGTTDLGRRLSVAGLRELAELLVAWLLRQGIRERHCVGVFIADDPLYYVFHIALCRIGAIPVHLNSKMPSNVAADYLRRVGCFAILVDSERAARLESHATAIGDVRLLRLESVELRSDVARYDPYVHGPDDPVLIAHTSGTTGAPKPVQFNHHGYFFGVRQQMFQPVGRKVASALPHSHGSAITMFMSTVVRAVPLLAQTRKDPLSFLDSIQSWRPNLVMAFPKPLVDLCRQGPEQWDLSSVSCWMSTGDASHERHIRRLIACGSRAQGSVSRRGSTYIDNLGSSEFAFGILRHVHSPETNAYARCIGRPFEWVEVEILGEDGAPVPTGTVGRLGVKSPSVTSGYWKDPAATQANRLQGYWLTGDLVFRNTEGVYFHVDRTTDRTLIAQRMIYSCQVEELLMARIEEIFDCTVVGVVIGDDSHAAVSVELLGALDDREALEGKIRTVLREVGVSCPVRIDLVEPGWNEGLTGKKLKRTIRASLGSAARV
jgi:long-chain acyl-CoA synthetase